jgi:hypothetical protein
MEVLGKETVLRRLDAAVGFLRGGVQKVLEYN